MLFFLLIIHTLVIFRVVVALTHKIYLLEYTRCKVLPIHISKIKVSEKFFSVLPSFLFLPLFVGALLDEFESQLRKSVHNDKITPGQPPLCVEAAFTLELHQKLCLLSGIRRGIARKLHLKNSPDLMVQLIAFHIVQNFHF